MKSYFLKNLNNYYNKKPVSVLLPEKKKRGGKQGIQSLREKEKIKKTQCPPPLHKRLTLKAKIQFAKWLCLTLPSD